MEDTVTLQLTAPKSLVEELLVWVSSQPRTYGETMEAWRTSCPRMPVWEDAILNKLVEVIQDDVGLNQYAVTLTTKGRSILDGHLL